MESFVILIVGALLLYAILTISRKWADSFVLIAFAIGCAVNANIFHSATAPVIFGPFTFSIDSVLSTVFLFTVAVKYFHYPKKDAQSLVKAAIVAIILSAFIEFIATISADGALQAVKQFGFYIFSAIGFFLAIFAMIKIMELMEKKHISRYITLFVILIVGSIINSSVYYVLQRLIMGSLDENFIFILIGSYLGKLFSIFLSVLSYFISVKWLIPNELKNK